MQTDIFSQLNPQQREAVEHTEGPLLILAGAGSGKTRVLTTRIAYLIAKKGVAPWNILAITFTNKAAEEMRERVDALVERGAAEIWVSTFHSCCNRILRRHIDQLGYDSNFSIYDTDDSRQVMKEVIRYLELDPKQYKERGLLARVSAAKNEMITPEEMAQKAVRWEERNLAEIYAEYERRLRRNNALDFDDLLVKTVQLFDRAPEVLERYQERFRYILVDEYQDTNTVQFKLVSRLAAVHRNLCVVGDDDQSIYKFRGANIQNILGFERVFPDAKVIRLEQNYRSTARILDAANGVIANNAGRKAKHLWTENGEGAKIRFFHFPSGYEEAEFIAGEIAEKVKFGEKTYRDFAVLYRTNAQSRMFEEKFVTANIPYKLVGGVNFYARREVKDMLAYLKTVDNGVDDLSVERIINVPRRGIGDASIGKVEDWAAAEGLSFYEALERADEIPGVARAAGKIRAFTGMIEDFRQEAAAGAPVSDLIERILDRTGYEAELRAEETDEAAARLENLEELVSKAADYWAHTEQPALSDFLQQVSLVADIDSVDPDSDYVLLMTLHGAKGLEFDSVYMAGMEDGIFPGFLSISDETGEELEEERRLCYVGITRAQRSLTLTSAQQRLVRGEAQFLKTSRFVHEIPRELVDLGRNTTDTRRAYDGAPRGQDAFGSWSAGAPRGRYGSAAYQNREEREFGARVGSVLGMGRPKPQKNKFKLDDFKVEKADTLDYCIGDTVRHVKFGVGVVQDITDGGRDHEVTVEFENYGVKRMFASFAKLKKI